MMSGRGAWPIEEENRVRSAIGLPVNTLTTTNFVDLFGIRQDPGLFRAPYAQHPWVYATIRAMAQNWKGVPVVVKQGKPEGRIPPTDRARELRKAHIRADSSAPRSQAEDQGVPVVDPSNPTVALFRRPNPFMSRAQLWEATATHLWNSGGCVWVKIGRGGQPVSSANEHPVELWPVAQTGWEPQVNQQSLLPDYWRGPWGDTQRRFEPHQLVWFRFFSPYDWLKGQPPLEPIQVTAEADYRAMRYNARFFQNGARPGGLVKVKGYPTEVQLNQFKSVWNEMHRGEERAHSVGFLLGDADFVDNATNQKDMEFSQLRDGARREILSGLGPIPPLLLGLSDDYTRATAMEAKGVLFENTLLPQMGDAEDVLEVEVGNWTQGRMWIEFDLTKVEALRDNTADKATAATQFFAMGVPFEVINEKLELGFEVKSLPHAKESFLPSTMRLADDVVAGIDALGAANPGGAGGDPNMPADKGGTPGAVGKASTPSGTTSPSPKRDAGERAAKERRWGSLANAVFATEAKTLAAFKRYLSLLRNWTLGHAREVVEQAAGTHRASSADNPAMDMPLRFTQAMVEQILFNEQEWDRELRRVMGSMYRATAANNLKVLQAELGKAIQVIAAEDPRVLDLMARKELKVVEINATVRTRIRETMLKALAETENVTQTAAQLQQRLGDDLRATFNSLAGRALTVARTETAQVANEVRAVGMRAAGITQHEWVSAHDSHVRESHQQVDGEVRVIGQSFSNGLTNPGQIGAPPEEVINCRCIAVAVVSGPPK